MEITVTKTTLGELQPGELFIEPGQENINKALAGAVSIGLIVNLRTNVPILLGMKDTQVYRLTVTT